MSNYYFVPQEHGVFVSICTALVLFVLGATTSLFCFASVFTWPWQMEWPVVEGRLTSIRPHGRMDADVVYTYDVEGHTYTSNERRLDSLEHTLKAGQEIMVRHHPTRFGESAMQAGFNIIETPFLILVSLGLFIASGMFASMRLIAPKR